MKENWLIPFLIILSAILCSGCQVNQSGTEIRTEEQMLDISFENGKAEELFHRIVHGTEREIHYTKLVGTPSCSLYSRYEQVAFNAHCNDHIKAMDSDENLMISQKEAEDYYQHLLDRGKLKEDK